MFRQSKFFVGVLAVAFLLSLTTQAVADDARGTVRSVNAEKNQIVLKGIVSDTTYNLTKEAWVVLDGRRCKLTELKDGDRAQISYDKKNNEMIAYGARCLRTASETTGTVRFVITDKNELVLKGVVKDTAYFMEKDVKIYIDTKERNFSDLREGDEVGLTYVQRDDRLMVNEVRVTKRAK